MPSTSQNQQQLFGLALSVKRGEKPRSEVSDSVLKIVDTMSEKKIKDFAETSHNGLPTTVETQIRKVVREVYRENVLGESTRRSNDFFEESKHGIAISKLLNGKWDRSKVKKYFDSLGGGSDTKWIRAVEFIASDVGLNVKKYDNKPAGEFVYDTIDAIGELYKTHNESVNESVNESASIEAMGISAFTGTRGDAVQKFIDTHNIDSKKLFKYVKGGNLSDRMDFVTALAGKDGNKIQKMIISKFAMKESVNENNYKDAVSEFNSELMKHPSVKKLADYYKKSISEIIKVLQVRLSTKGDRAGNTTEVWIDFTDTISGISVKHKKKLNTEVIESVEQLDEKLITFSNRAPYGQVVFIAGGAGSGKGYAISNFLDSAGFKVRDVDEMKKQLQKLNAIGKLSIQQIIDKFGNSITPSELENIKKIQSDGYDLKTMDLKNPNHVMALHILVKSMGIKDQSLANMLTAAKNPDVLPNIMFDITAKEISDITDVLPQLTAAGYNPNNIHLVWILANYQVAITSNQERDRVVPQDILLKTHIGAGNTIWSLVTRALPNGMNGRVDVILNNRENTIPFTEKDGKTPIKVQSKGKKKPEIVVKSFLSLPIKKQGGSIIREEIWKKLLFRWIKDNAPHEITAYM